MKVIDSKTTAYHPAGNAHVERVHRFFRLALTSFVRKDQRDWDAYVPGIVLAYNSAYHETTGSTPAALFLGRELRVPGEIEVSPAFQGLNDLSYAQKVEYLLSRAQSIVNERLAQIRRKKAGLNEGVQLTRFKEDDKVLLYVPQAKRGKAHKLSPHWHGPYLISRKTRNEKVYYLKNEFGEEMKFPVSVTRLKLYHDRMDLKDRPAIGTLRDDMSRVLADEIERWSQPVARDDGSLDEMAPLPPGDADYAPEASNPTLRPHRRARGYSPAPEDLDDSDLDQFLDFTAVNSPEALFGTGKVVSDKNKAAALAPAEEVPTTVQQPLNAANRRMLGHEAYLSDDGQSIILKTRVAVDGKRRTRKPLRLEE